jgi:hypothetical protein
MTRHNTRVKDRILKAVASGSYATGGDTLDLTNVANPNFKTDAKFGQNVAIEDWEVIQSPAGYGAELVQGATLATWKLKVFTTANTELGAGAYPGAITGDYFVLRFSGPKAIL